MNVGLLKTSIEQDISSSTAVSQDLGNNEYLVELDSKEGADALIDEGLTLETSAFRISVRWPIYIINSVDKTKFLLTKGLILKMFMLVFIPRMVVLLMSAF